MNNHSIIEIAPISTPSAGFCILNEFSNGGRVELIDGYKVGNDDADLKTIARDFAMKGHRVQIATSIHYKDERYRQVFGRLIGTEYERKCPDLIVDSKFYEYESYLPPVNSGKISHMISSGLKQASRVIIDNNEGCAHRYIQRSILARLKDTNFKYDISEVWLYENGKVGRLF